MRAGWNSKQASRRILRMAGILSSGILLFYLVMYRYQPFSDLWNDFLSVFFTQLASLLAAAFATLVWNRYERTDPPRRVWGWFAGAMWLWFAAELIWGYLYMTVDEVPVSLADLLWIVSYGLLGLALIHQFRLLVQPTKRRLWIWIAIALLTLFTLTLILYRAVISAAQAPGSLEAVVNSFYPAADLVLAVVALWLTRNFMGGAFSRPWFGLLIFSFSDLLYAWLETSGMYAWSLEQGDVLTTIADAAYLGSYLVLGLGLLSMWLFLKYGLRTHPDAR